MTECELPSITFYLILYKKKKKKKEGDLYWIEVMEFSPEWPRIIDTAPPEHQVDGCNPGEEAE